jgi:hypothetical protein
MSRKVAEQFGCYLVRRLRLGEAMSWFNCGVPRLEAELMVRYEVGMFNQRKEAFEKELFKNFGGN